MRGLFALFLYVVFWGFALVLAGGQARSGEDVKVTYDALGRMTSYCSSKMGMRTEYSYDAVGNRTVVQTISVAECTAEVNTPPTAVDDAVTVPFNVPVYFDPRGNDIDGDGDVLTITSAVSSDPDLTVQIAFQGTELVIVAESGGVILSADGEDGTSADPGKSQSGGSGSVNQNEVTQNEVPQAGYFGDITYEVSDGRGGTDTAIVVVSTN